MTDSRAISVSVVIPAYNEAENLPQLLAALTDANIATALEIIVVDGDSQDGTADAARRFQGVSVLRSEIRNTAAQRNIGGAAARYELLVFLDADTLPSPDFLSRVTACFAAKPFAVACPWFIPTSRNVAIRAIYILFNCLFWLSQRRYHTGAGVCIVTPRWVFDQTNGFREDLSVGEDIGYIQAASRLGRHAHLTVSLITSSRRFERFGIIKTLRQYLQLSPVFLSGNLDSLTSINYATVPKE